MSYSHLHFTKPRPHSRKPREVHPQVREMHLGKADLSAIDIWPRSFFSVGSGSVSVHRAVSLASDSQQTQFPTVRTKNISRQCEPWAGVA